MVIQEGETFGRRFIGSTEDEYILFGIRISEALGPLSIDDARRIEKDRRSFRGGDQCAADPRDRYRVDRGNQINGMI